MPDLVILDGNHDWLTDPTRWACFAVRSTRPAPSGVPPVTTMIKADLKCSSVAAASVLAKVERDAMMVALAADVPGTTAGANKGYSAPEHLAALRVHGPCEHHRRSWRLPGVPGLEGGTRPRPRGGRVADEDPPEDRARTGGGGRRSRGAAESVMGDDERVPEVSVR